MAKKFTKKQELFVKNYLVNGFNATQAARDAGYKGSYDTIRKVGSENLTKPHIQTAIHEEMIDHAMDGPEVLARLQTLATGIDIAQFYEFEEIEVTHTNKKQETSTHFVKVLQPDLKAIQAAGYGHLIQKITMRGLHVEIVWKDQLKALTLLARINDLLTHKESPDPDRPLLIVDDLER